jgi:hypothetical protein
MKQDYKKTKKINKLKQVFVSMKHTQDRESLQNIPVLFSGRDLRVLPKTIPNSKILLVTKDLHIIDTVDGCQMETTSGDTIFTLVPQHDSNQKRAHVNKTLTVIICSR